jgi:hypothetical protein
MKAHVLLALLLVLGGCGTRDGRPRLIMPRACPDGGPVKFLQDPACGRDCGYSCLPDRWKVPDQGDLRHGRSQYDG